jgi:purine nucleosidase
MTRRFIIDTDTASDDAVAIVMALQQPDVQVDAITVVYGNMPLEVASANARYSVEICGQTTPVYEGCAQPLLRAPAYADWFHGPYGMGKLGQLHPRRPAAGGNAVEELIRRFAAAPGAITLVTLGPLTNIAAALAVEPRLAEWVKECYVMGGAACCVGNVTPAAEFNIWCDPEAAALVFRSGMRLLMVGWEHCRGESALNDEEIASVYSFDTERARFAMDCNSYAYYAGRTIQKEQGLMLPDPVTMAIAIDPSVCTQRSPHHVEISCDAALTRGMTVVDQLGVTKQPANAEVCWAIATHKWKEMLYRALR